MMPLRAGPLVRAVTANSAVIWAELPYPDEVSLSTTAATASQEPGTAQAHTVTVRTVAVGSRYYAALQLTGLQSATWYHYHINSTREQSPDGNENKALALQCFRTLDPSDAGRPLTLAYGSCRKSSQSRHDALSAFGSWLVRHYNEREKCWPRLLLLIGDQIYADDPSRASISSNPQLRGGAKTFAEFASLYEFAWTHDPNVRQALAVLPTYMICDDHEVTNSWNTMPFWRLAALKRGHEQLLVDGLVAYWIYQAWGNLLPSEATHDSRLHIMEEAARSGEDVLEALRSCMRSAVYGESHLQWHYTIPTSPPLFVSDARADRDARFNSPLKAPGVESSARIISREQMGQLKDWLRAHDDKLAIIVSSVPVLLPPLIGLAEYLMGIRAKEQRRRVWRRLARVLGLIQHGVSRRIQFDHWPVFGETWNELVECLTWRRHEIVVLSGDVHFSYTMEARLAKAVAAEDRTTNTRLRLLQFVCSPLDNKLGAKSRRRILAQSWCRRATYGGLRTRMRDLLLAPQAGKRKHRVHSDLLLGNTLALLTFQPQEDGSSYRVSQQYVGPHGSELQAIASSTVQIRSHIMHHDKCM